MNALKLNTLEQFLNTFSHDHGHGVSPKYRPINTATIVNKFRNAGFEVSRWGASRVNKADKAGFQQHSIWFRHSKISGFKSNAIPEIQFVSSYDGSCAYRLYKALFRPACSNGLVMPMSCGVARVVHLGDAAKRAVDEALRLIGESESMLNMVNTMESKQLTGLQAIDFAKHAGQLVFPDGALFEASKLLVNRRTADEGQDLWTVFNVVQENLLSGGAKYLMPKVDQFEVETLAKRTARKVQSIDRVIKLNQDLFSLALTYAKGA